MYIWALARAAAVGLLLLAVALLSACADDGDTPAAESPQPTVEAPPPTTAAVAPSIHVVGTTNFVADWARVVGGDRVEVFGLLPAGADPHSFLPGTQDITKVADADVVFTIGLGLEGDWIEDLLHNASADETKIVALGDSISPMEFTGTDMHDDHDDHEDDDDHMDDDHDDHEDEDDDHMDDDHDDHEDDDDHMDDDHDDHEEDDDHMDDEDGHDEHDHGAYDPHFWFDPLRVKIAVGEIAARFSAIDPENAETYFQNAANYWEELDELHAWIQVEVEKVAPERRLLVTSHDSFAYFAEAYGFEIVGLVIPSLAPHVEPSAEHIADLVDVVREREVPAVFGETTVSERMAQAVARETGADLVQLYSGSLGIEGSGAETYLGMMRSNVERMVEALR